MFSRHVGERSEMIEGVVFRKAGSRTCSLPQLWTPGCCAPDPATGVPSHLLYSQLCPASPYPSRQRNVSLSDGIAVGLSHNHVHHPSSPLHISSHYLHPSSPPHLTCTSPLSSSPYQHPSSPLFSPPHLTYTPPLLSPEHPLEKCTGLIYTPLSSSPYLQPSSLLTLPAPLLSSPYLHPLG